MKASDNLWGYYGFKFFKLRFGTGTAGGNGTPNAKASIQLLPDRFRWIGEIKAPLNGKALLALAPEQPGVDAFHFV